MTTEEQNQEESQETKQEEEAPKPARRRRTKASEGEATAEAKPARRRRTKKADAEEAAEEVAARPPLVQRPLPRMQEMLRNEVGPTMMQEFGYTSPMQIPSLNRIVLNIGLGEALTNARALEAAIRDLTMITGQKPVTNRAKKSIAGFKIREGMAIGVSVSIRGRRMWEFFDRLVSSTLPRIRDFQGVSRRAFDGRGNYSLGISEQVIFPEIDYNSIDRIRGLQVVIGTSAPNDAEGLRMLELLGMPFTRTMDAERVA